MPTLGEVVALVHRWYPPETADDWDAVGLAAGDPGADVRRILLAVDPALPTAREAAEWNADLLLTHHPLFLRGVHGVAETSPKGRTLATLTRARCGLLTAHTNADHGSPGVSDALARALGLRDVRPVDASGPPLDKLVVFAPPTDADPIREAIAEAGAGRIGDYDSCSWMVTGEGRFRPLDGDGRVQAPLPGRELRQTFGRRRRAFVREIVGDTGVGVDRRDVRTHRLRQQPRRHRKILVVRPGHGLACGVGARQHVGAVGHCQILVRNA